MDYRRVYQPGGRYFFTVVTHNRIPIFTHKDRIDHLRQVIQGVQHKRPFIIEAIVILPDHLHTVWHMPEGDTDFSTRWSLIKRNYSVSLNVNDVNHSRQTRREKGIWQRRFWEHVLRDEEDWRRHIDYIHYNPVKHGYVKTPFAWPYSSFRRAVSKGWYERDWGRQEPDSVKDLWLE